jgi:hypothetical protein
MGLEMAWAVKAAPRAAFTAQTSKVRKVMSVFRAKRVSPEAASREAFWPKGGADRVFQFKEIECAKN